MSTLNVNTVNTTTINPTGGVEVLFGGSAPPKYSGSPLVTANSLPTVAVTDAGNYYAGTGLGDQLQEIGAALTSIATTGSGSMANIIKAFYRLANPVGKVTFGYWATAPAGALLLNGQTVSRTTYADLWAFVSTNSLAVSESAWAAGQNTKFSVGDGATTFRLPDIRGEGIRATDLGRGVDTGRTVGTWQDGDIQSHNHDNGLFINLVRDPYPGSLTGGDNTGSGIEMPVGGSSDFGPIQPYGGAETRMRNVALTAVINY